MHALPSVLRAALIAGTGQPPLVTASALADLAGVRGLELLATLAVDKRLAPTQQTVVLLAVSLLLATHPGTLPPADALDAVEDAETASAAIHAGLGAALTGILQAAPREASLSATRRLIGRRLAAAGELGPHVVQLLLDAGDRERAAQIAAADLGRFLAGHDRRSAETSARLRVLMTWSEDAELFARIVENLARLHPSALSVVEQLIREIDDLDPVLVARARSAVVWALGNRGPER